MKVLDENPSRVDFVSFVNGTGHLIEIDGPSHYAAYDEVTYSYRVDEMAYARISRLLVLWLVKGGY